MDAESVCVKKISNRLHISESTVRDVLGLKVRDTIVGRSPFKKASFDTLSKECVKRSKMKLYDYQNRVVDSVDSNRGTIVVHSVGAGKTLTAVAVGECFLEKNPKGKVIAILPKSLVDNFKKELQAAYGDATLDRYIFITHNKFARDAKNGRMRLPIRDNLVIIDELHNYRTKISPKHVAEYRLRRTKENKKRLPSSYFVCEALKPAAKVLGMTATPFVNDIHDLLTIVSIVKGEDIYMKATGKKLLPLLKENSEGVFSFYERDEHDPRFPSYTIHKVEIVMPDDYFKKYIDIEKMESKFAQSNFSEAFLSNIRTASNSIDNTNHSPKVRWVIDKVVSTVKNGGKSVVYSSYIDSGINIIKELLEKEGIGVNFISGAVSRERRTEIVQEYNTRKKPVLLITRAGGEGLDLKETTNVITLEPPWTGSGRNQIFGRAVRNGSHLGLDPRHQHVDCYILLMVKPRPPVGYNEKKDPKKMYKNPSGDKSVYHVAETKEKTANNILSQLDDISLEGNVVRRWFAHRDESHYLPGEKKARPGVYEWNDVQIIDDAMAKIMEKVTGTPRKRGRPRKSESTKKKPYQKTGRPRGRPRKGTKKAPYQKTGRPRKRADSMARFIVD